MSYRLLPASEAFWRPSNQMGIDNTDLGGQPELADTLEMSVEQLASLYPDGPKALPPELS